MSSDDLPIPEGQCPVCGAPLCGVTAAQEALALSKPRIHKLIASKGLRASMIRFSLKPNGLRRMILAWADVEKRRQDRS